MRLHTKRLYILPLTVEQFLLLIKNKAALEQELGVSSIQLDHNTRTAMEILYKDALQDKENYIWYTNWQIILKSQNISAGSACFKGAPENAEGEVEIGYGINKEFRNNGYMKEAVLAICKWALKQPGVRKITAETSRDNPASQRVLLACGMSKYKETEESLFWQIKKR